MTTLTANDLELLGNTWLQLEAQRTEIVQRQAEITSQLRELDYGVHPAGERAISVSEPQRRFNRQQAEVTLPVHVLREITIPFIDATLARKVLPPALYEACQLPVGETRVSIR